MATTAAEWLIGTRDYDAGIEILKAAGASDFLLDLLASGPDPYNTPRLLQEIEQLASQAPASMDLPALDEEQAATAATAKPAPYTPDKDLEKTIRYKERIRQLFKEMNHLKGQLPTLPEGPQLLACARGIVKRDLRKQDLWEHLHYFEQNGKWFDELPENQPKPFDLEKAIKNAMSNRSKALAALKKPLPVVMRDHYTQKAAEFDKKVNDLISLRSDGQKKSA